MTELNDICNHVGDLTSFATLDHKIVQRGLGQALDELHAPDLEAKLAPIRGRLCQTLTHVQQEFVARDDAVEAVMASLISGVPAVLLGPPGTAKSAIVRELARRCGLGPHQHGQGGTAQGYFEYLLTSHTMPEELFGAPDLKVLTQDSVFQRNTEGMLPTAQLAFLDEVFRGGSHILNTLLSILNEKIFHDGRSLILVPLVGIIGATNEAPLDPDLKAFFDRFPIRIWLDSIFDEDQPHESDADLVSSLLTASARHEMRNLKMSYLGGQIDPSAQLSCMNDFRCARAIITLQQHDELIRGERHGGQAQRTEEFLDLFKALFRQCRLSDRTLFSLKRFAQALSWLTEDPRSDQTRLAHFQVFRFLASNSQERHRLDMEVNDAIQGSGHASID